MDIPLKYVTGLVGTLIGALGTLGVAILNARTDEEANEIEAAKVANESLESALESVEKRVDTLEARVDDAEAAEQRCQKRLEAEREERKKLEGEVEKLSSDVDEYRQLAEEAHRRYDKVAAKIEQDPDVDWDPHNV